MQELIKIGHTYFQHFLKGEFTELIDLFSEDGVVEMDEIKTAREFYAETAEFVSIMKFELQEIYGSKKSGSIAIHFLFDVKQEDGSNKTRNGVDIVEFDSNNKIQKLTIIHS